MSEQQIPDPPEAIEPPPEIFASIVASIRGGSTDPTDDQIAAFEANRARVSLADAEARERSRLAAERRQAEADQQAQEAAQQRASEGTIRSIKGKNRG